MEYYKEKSSLYLLVFILFPLYTYFIENNTFGSIVISLIILSYTFASIHKYSVTSNILKIHTDFFSSKYININSILKIERRKFNIKSKYFSFDKIVLKLTNDEEFKISPKEEQEFIKHLLSINPNIDVRI
jgi:hypothetical protein